MTLFDAVDATQPVSAPAPTVRVRLVVAYDGSGFHGFAANTGVRTVGGTLATAASTVLGHPVELTCAGRTDKGVHARGQVVTFDVAVARLDLDRLVRSLNGMCGPAIAVTAASVVDDTFDARFSATSRRYRYQILNRRAPDPFLAPYAWHVDEPLSRPALDLACDPLMGEHDFSAFCRRPKRRDGEPASLVRRVVDATWHESEGDLLRFEIEASAFCHQMVRSIVGTLVEVGIGKRHAGELLGIIASRDRSRAGALAPSQGLALWTVRYDDWSSA